MEINAENRSANIAIRSCSFCRRPGHYVNNCNNHRLIDFDRRCRYEIELSIRYHDNPNQRFLNWLLEYSVQNNDLIRAFASSKLGISIRNRNIGDIIDEIHNHYCVRYSISQRRNIQSEDLFENTERPHESIPQSQPQEIYQIRRENPIIRTLNQNMDELIDVLTFLNSIERLNREIIENINNRENGRFNISTKIIDNSDDDWKQNECFICYEDYSSKNFVKLNCNHEFCKDCIKEQIKSTITENVCCALCRNIVNNIEIRDNEILEEINNIIL